MAQVTTSRIADIDALVPSLLSPEAENKSRRPSFSLSVVGHHVREPSAAHCAVHERDLDSFRADAS